MQDLSNDNPDKLQTKIQKDEQERQEKKVTFTEITADEIKAQEEAALEPGKKLPQNYQAKPNVSLHHMQPQQQPARVGGGHGHQRRESAWRLRGGRRGAERGGWSGGGAARGAGGACPRRRGPW